MRLRGTLVTCLTAALLLVPRIGVSQAAPARATLAGRVVDANYRPVAEASVTIEGFMSSSTDSAGRFAFPGLETETMLLRVQRLGYAPATRTVVFMAEAPQEVEIRLGLRATVLASVNVIDSSDIDPRGYARRRRIGEGFFLTRDDIRERGPTPRVENLLAALPGLKLEAGVVKLSRGRISILGDNCEDGVQYIVDGARAGPALTTRLSSPEMLTGIEIYKTASATPAVYRTARTGCGTVVLWTY